MNKQINVKRGEKCPECGRYYNRHIVTDNLIIKDKEILLIRRANEPSKGYWALPGGYLNWDETIEEAAIREATEETGMQVKINKFFNVYSRPDRDGDVQNVALVYVLEVLDYTFHPQQEEVSDIRWFSLDSLPGKIAFDHKEIIEDYKKSNNL
jgi:ADP-ribose pyrophosphatase YjhB (NUDIX family)